jgi:hypothetical protein
MREGFEPRPELRLRPPHPAGHGAYPPVTAGEQGDDAVGFPELLRPQDDAVVPEETHEPILAYRVRASARLWPSPPGSGASAVSPTARISGPIDGMANTGGPEQ